MINIILELALVDNLVDLLAHTLTMAVRTNLTDDIWAEFALAEFEILVNWLLRILNNIINVERSELVPFSLNVSPDLFRLLFIIKGVHHGQTRFNHLGTLPTRSHVGRFIKSCV